MANTAPKIPSCLPTIRPNATPSTTGCDKSLIVTLRKSTPALKNAKIGTIRKLTQLDSRCSQCCIGRTYLRPHLPLSGIVIAKITPAMVACRPDFNTQYQRIKPKMIYGKGLT